MATVLVGGSGAEGVAVVHVLQRETAVAIGQLVDEAREIFWGDVTGYHQNPQQIHTELEGGE